MLFCLTANYTPQALKAMRANPNTNRREAVQQLLEAAGAKLISIYGTIADGPGALVIFDADPVAAGALTGVAASAAGIQNVKIMRLLSQDDVLAVRQKAKQIEGSYRPPGR